jgi:hypothetical protein
MDGIAGLSIAADPVPGRPGAAGEPAARQWRVLHRLAKTAIGTRGLDGAVSLCRRERAGTVLFGPYWRLPSGSYRLGFRCRAGQPRLAGQPVLGVEIIALNRNQQAWRDFTAEELCSGDGSLDFEVPPPLSLEAGEEARFEFRFFHLGNADLTISAVDLRQLDEDAALPAGLREWRLLGRLSKTLLGKRHPMGGIATSLPLYTGCILCGGRPYLHLPEGSYRLVLRGAALGRRHRAGPIVGVEVIALKGWREGWSLRAAWSRETPAKERILLARRDFTAAELDAGPGEVDFAVTASLSLDADEDSWFEIKVRQLGNARLTIAALDLRQLAEETDQARATASAPAAALPRPGAASRRNVVVIGNCQAETVREGFLRAPALSRRFTAKYHFVGLQKPLHAAARRELAEADLILVQDIQDWEDYPLRDAIPQRAEMITFPFLRFASPWPFDHHNGPDDKEAFEREWPNLTFLNRDGLLARLRREIPDKEARFLAYRGLELDGVVNYLRLHDFEKRRLLALDRRFGFAIGEYVLANFQTRQLFYTTNHPNRQLVTMLMEWLMRRMGLDEAFPTVERLDHLKRLQVPLHPKVARALGVTWADERTKYLYEGRSVTWESYTRAYIEHYG